MEILRMLDSGLRHAMTAETDVDVAFKEAQKRSPDMDNLTSLIANMDDSQKSKLVDMLMRVANPSGSPMVQSLSVPSVLENCLKAGLSPNQKGQESSILYYYAAPQNIETYVLLVNEFGAAADGSTDKAFLLRGRAQFGVNLGSIEGFSEVFNYLTDTRTSNIAADAGVPLQSNWQKSYDKPTIELAENIQNYLGSRKLG
jgi:hypothetical protein